MKVVKEEEKKWKAKGNEGRKSGRRSEEEGEGNEGERRRVRVKKA